MPYIHAKWCGVSIGIQQQQGPEILTKRSLQKCMLGSNLWVPQELGPRQMAGILPPWPGLPWVGFLQTFKSPFATPSSGEFPRSDGSSSHWQWNASHLLQYNMIAITGFCFHCVQNKTGFFLKVLYHLEKSKKICGFSKLWFVVFLFPTWLFITLDLHEKESFVCFLPFSFYLKAKYVKLRS